MFKTHQSKQEMKQFRNKLQLSDKRPGDDMYLKRKNIQ